MTAPETRNERKERTRRALLDAALRQASERGFAGVSLREIAKQAGVVPTAVYRHFASMDELGVTLVEESMRTLRTMIREARAVPGGSDDLIRASVLTLSEHVRSHEDHYWFLVRERYGGTGAVRQTIGVELKLLTGELAVDLARFDGLRTWPTGDLRMLADLVVSAMFSTVLELLEARPGADAEIVETAQRALRLIFVGAGHWRSS
ncbi:TetR family transcriptional regulator [Saccharomonospora sp. CUA-673]|uniref:TetR family transcriptional regulator n=1 Tax=Saccharomonospora sp. CUA-673 TaxID=1904969 RepID=UPI0009687BC0|nr:TetR family transcriptional regulator [Saccharomonospora sp. CUA-673]OLT47083.1 TetR family transcriptional regulator [Saccharomonospora sp. CUA-673]